MAVRMSEFPTEATVIPTTPVSHPVELKVHQPHQQISVDNILSKVKQEGTGREFICGWGAASVNIIATFPINKVIFRQQLNGVSTVAALRQLRGEGIVYLYRGVLPPLLQKSASLSIMFGMYDKFSQIFCRRFTTVDPRLNHAAAAMMAGCIEATLAPLERVQTLLQDKAYHSRYRNTIHAFYDIGRVHGTREFFRGVSAILMRNGPSNVMFFNFRNDIKQCLPSATSTGGELLINFLSGGIIGAAISTIFFPVNLVKTHMQSKIGGPFTSCYRTFLVVYAERNGNVRALFRGIHVNYARSVISWGVINASYELLKYIIVTW